MGHGTTRAATGGRLLRSAALAATALRRLGVCTPPTGQQFCLCWVALEWAKYLLGLSAGIGQVFYPLGHPDEVQA